MVNSLTPSMRIELQEYGESHVISASIININTLAEANKRWKRNLGLSVDPIRIEDIGNGLLKLRAEAVTGVVRIGNIDIEIAPKFLDQSNESWQTVLWRILTVVEGSFIDSSLTAAEEQNSLSIPDLLAEMFLSSYARGAAKGLPRSYVAEQRADYTLRGQLDPSRMSEWATRPWLLPVITDMLTDNTVLARLIRWSAECLSATVKSPGRSRAMREIVASLSHVSKSPPHLFEAQQIILGPQHQGLEAARLVGLLLLEGKGIHHAGGKHALSGFLWNSDAIYENYVYWLCRRAASQRKNRVGKCEMTFGEVMKGNGSSLRTTPDVIFYNAEGTPVAITDAKYKRLGSKPKASDTYQVLTAGHVVGCQRVSLTYPVSTNREPTVWKVQSALGGNDIELTVLPINLMGLIFSYGQNTLINTIGAWLDGTIFDTKNQNEYTEL